MFRISIKEMVKLKSFWLLGFILIVGLVVRLYRINEPLADWHSWRQADTAAVTREYVKNGIDLLRPRYRGGGWWSFRW